MVVEYKVADFGFVRYYLAPKVGRAGPHSWPGWVAQHVAATVSAMQRLPCDVGALQLAQLGPGLDGGVTLTVCFMCLLQIEDEEMEGE